MSPDALMAKPMVMGMFIVWLYGHILIKQWSLLCPTYLEILTAHIST